MLLNKLSGISGGGGGGGGLGGAMRLMARHFSRARAENLRKINPRLPPQEAKSIAQSVYQVIKDKGAVSISNAWNHVQEAGIDSLSSKTHMKLMLKWMRGRKMLKQFCHLVGSNKKFLLTTLPEDPQISAAYLQAKLETQKKACVEN
ncbi:hypothetical protein Syun_020049 [Stephania yunnanensis]|uniref:Uncharacterized protein n=1 Tax=Stephania yunnanensis TaxID=152371 RepID=A0AAP0IX67_9MAGN